jgi:hypothetical protein
MPVIEVCIVVPNGGSIPPGAAKALADAVDGVLQAGPGKVWVRVNALPQSLYAESGDVEDASPVFVRILRAQMPDAEHLAHEAQELAHAIAGCLGRGVDLVHIEYEPAARGRVAFGGRLLR